MRSNTHIGSGADNKMPKKGSKTKGGSPPPLIIESAGASLAIPAGSGGGGPAETYLVHSVAVKEPNYTVAIVNRFPISATFPQHAFAFFIGFMLIS